MSERSSCEGGDAFGGRHDSPSEGRSDVDQQQGNRGRGGVIREMMPFPQGSFCTVHGRRERGPRKRKKNVVHRSKV